MVKRDHHPEITNEVIKRLDATELNQRKVPTKNIQELEGEKVQKLENRTTRLKQGGYRGRPEIGEKLAEKLISRRQERESE